MSYQKHSLMALLLLVLNAPLLAQWSPPERLSRQQIVGTSRTLMARPDLPYRAREEVDRIRALQMDRDVGAMVYRPEDASRIPRGPDGKKVGVFLIHGGGGDHRSKDDMARLLVGKYGFQVVSMTYPGYLYLPDPSRDWPGEPVTRDGKARLPIWNKDRPITHDQYELIQDDSMADRYGTLFLACAREGTEFYHRMAAYPVAFEETARHWIRKHLPAEEFSIYIHGHSTGGPFSFILTQRVPHIVGVLGMENSPFGAIYSQLIDGRTWTLPFFCLSEFSWRLRAMYAGYEALQNEGEEALKRLAMLMQQVFDSYQRSNVRPRFKAGYPVHLNGTESLVAAARATAGRLGLDEQATQELVRRYRGLSAGA